MIEVYRGSANTWECDEMGHMNVRFYVARMMEGLAEFAHRAGMPQAFRATAAATLLPRDQHIRFVREALAGKPLIMRACVLETGVASASVYQQIDHANGEPCAAFRTVIDHVDQGGSVFPWPERVRQALEALKDEAPANLQPRSLDLSIPPCAAATMADADAVGALTIGRGVVLEQHCDHSGRMAPEFFIGRISDSVGHLLGPWRQELAAAAAVAGGPIVRTGGAVLEYRLVYRRWPRAGDRLVIRSGLGEVKEKTNSFVHWVLDPDTGDAWCTTEAVTIALNLDTRKAIPAPPAQQQALRRHVPTGLRI